MFAIKLNISLFSKHNKLLFFQKTLKPLSTFLYSKDYIGLPYKSEINCRCRLKETSNIKACLLLQTIHIRGHRYFRRRPIAVTHPETKGKTLDDYVQEAKYQAGYVVEEEDSVNQNQPKSALSRDEQLTKPVPVTSQISQNTSKNSISRGEIKAGDLILPYDEQGDLSRITKPLVRRAKYGNEFEEERGSLKHLPSIGRNKFKNDERIERRKYDNDDRMRRRKYENDIGEERMGRKYEKDTGEERMGRKYENDIGKERMGRKYENNIGEERMGRKYENDTGKQRMGGRKYENDDEHMGRKFLHNVQEDRMGRLEYENDAQVEHIKRRENENDNEDEKTSLKHLNFKYYNTANKNTKLLLQHGKSPKLRYKQDVFLVEGWRLLAEALQHDLKPYAIFYSRSRLFRNLIPLVAENDDELAEYLNLYPLYKTPYATFKIWSSLVTPPGIIGAFPLSQALDLCSKPQNNSIPVTVILDQVRDPSNLGSILRTLAAAGVYKIIMMKGCCDLWDPKVVRSASGAHFHIHCDTRVPWSRLETQVHHSPSVYLADACSDGTDESTQDELSFSRAESHDTLDSLKNVALEESESQTAYEEDPETRMKFYQNESFNDRNHLKLFTYAPLLQHDYNEMRFDYDEDGEISPVVLILGGETGLSNCAKKYAVEKDGVQLSVPMQNNVESLNSAVATGIIVYEMQRQYKKIKQMQDEDKVKIDA